MLTEKIRTADARFGMLAEGCGVLAAFSGGPDSCAMLDALWRLSRERGFSLSAAHVNHLLRGEDSERDETFCRDFCRERKIPLEVRRIDVAALARERGKGIEETAREVRYAFFDEVLTHSPALDRVATAHTADDSAETVLFHMMRGTGLRGLGGIPPVRGRVIRPLIFATREEVVTYCREHEISYRIDATNADTVYARNFIRAELMPRLSSLYGNAAERIGRMSETLREDEDYLTAEAERVYTALGGGSVLARDALTALHPAVRGRVLRLAYSCAGGEGLEKTHLDAIATLLSGREPAGLSLPGGVLLRAERNTIRFLAPGKDSPVPKPFPLLLKEGENRVSCGSVWLFPHDGKKECERLKKVYNLFIYRAFDCDKIKNNVFVRTRLPGDRIRFGGMTRRLKKLLCAAHLTQAERDALPVLCDGDGVLWVPGFPPRDGAEASAQCAAPVFIGYARDQDGTAKSEDFLDGQSDQ